jgi:eukaryotic-like serine/threonine-protein kinase
MAAARRARLQGRRRGGAFAFFLWRVRRKVFRRARPLPAFVEHAPGELELALDEAEEAVGLAAADAEAGHHRVADLAEQGRARLGQAAAHGGGRDPVERGEGLQRRAVEVVLLEEAPLPGREPAEALAQGELELGDRGALEVGELGVVARDDDGVEELVLDRDLAHAPEGVDGGAHGDGAEPAAQLAPAAVLADLGRGARLPDEELLPQHLEDIVGVAARAIDVLDRREEVRDEGPLELRQRRAIPPFAGAREEEITEVEGVEGARERGALRPGEPRRQSEEEGFGGHLDPRPRRARGGHGSLQQRLEVALRGELGRLVRAEVLEEDRGEAAGRRVHPRRISEPSRASTPHALASRGSGAWARIVKASCAGSVIVTSVAMRCLSDTTVAEFAEGLLETEAASDVEQHISACAPCRSLVSELARQRSRSGELGAEVGPTDEDPSDGLGGIDWRGGADEDESAGLSRGAVLGRYVILEALGAGGMGVVLAAYDPELDRKIALKILRREILARAAGARLRLMREAQAMARVSHPNVLTVHDVGAIGDGLFIAMEYVDGATFAGWMAQAKRSWREVLALLEQAGRGLAAAHAAGLVHRDFKPENVLVARDGRVRVADFGLARALDLEAAPLLEGEETEAQREHKEEPAASLTRSGAILGTPAYMAPEQFEGTAVDARADQFSFCVALFEALHGKRPFSINTREAVKAETIAGRLRRPGEASGLPAHVRAAMERGLRAAPEDRFASMDALLAALAPSGQHGLRNRVLGVLAAVVLGVATVGAVRPRAPVTPPCSGAQERFAGAWGEESARSLRERFLATKLPYAQASFQAIQQALDTYGQGWSKMHTETCEATRVRGEQSDEVLSLRMLCLDRRLADVRALVSVLDAAERDQIAKASESSRALGDLAVCADVEALRSPVRLPERRESAVEAAAIGEQIARARALHAVGKYQEGLAVAAGAVARAEALQHAPTEAEALAALAQLQRESDDPRGAEASLRRAFSAAQAGHHDRAAALAAIELVDVVGARLHRVDEGLQWAWLGDALLRRGKEDEALVAQLQENRGDIYLAKTDYAHAGEHFERALASWQRAVGPQHFFVAAQLYNLGQVAIGQGDMVKALELNQRVCEILRLVLGPDHPKFAVALTALAGAHSNLGQFTEALPLFEKALAIEVPALGPEHLQVGRTHLTMGHALQALHETPRALASYHAALAIFERDPARLALTAEALQGIANAQIDGGLFQEALATDTRALAAFEQAFGPEQDQVGAVRLSLGEIELELGKLKEADEDLHRAVAVWEKVNGPDDFQIGIALTDLGKLEQRQGRAAQAVKTLERAVQFLEKYDGNPAFAAVARFELALVLWPDPRSRDRAKSLATQAEQALAGLGVAEAKELARVRAWLARTSAR